MRKIFSLLIAALFVMQGFSQQHTVTGVVTDAGTASGLPGVTVAVKGTTTSTQTDENGKFSINAGTGKVLVFSFVGYETREATIGGKNVVNISLSAGAMGLDEVVVVGYGSQVKRNVTGAVQNIDAKEIKDIPVAQM
ncbi:MAG TPA: carboxypeptidase-like regulatory domain-containing protein, partial [Agriterribacter sp.]|nr:carboxypeptidase-like regulatory domain-containing protein [Agriterribacter sp.]